MDSGRLDVSVAPRPRHPFARRTVLTLVFLPASIGGSRVWLVPAPTLPPLPFLSRKSSCRCAHSPGAVSILAES